MVIFIIELKCRLIWISSSCLTMWKTTMDSFCLSDGGWPGSFFNSWLWLDSEIMWPDYTGKIDLIFWQLVRKYQQEQLTVPPVLDSLIPCKVAASGGEMSSIIKLSNVHTSVTPVPWSGDERRYRARRQKNLVRRWALTNLEDRSRNVWLHLTPHLARFDTRSFFFFRNPFHVFN